VPAPTNLPFKVRTIGRVQAQPFHSTMGTYHDDIMITVFADGKGVYVHSGSHIEISKGMVGIVMPGPDVGLLISDRRQPYDHCYCRFAGQLAARMSADLLRAGGGCCFCRCSQWVQAWDLMIRMVAHRQASDYDKGFTVLDGMLATLLATLAEPQQDAAARGGISAERLIDYMHRNIAEPFDLGKVAAHFGISRPHLCRVARALLGQTLHTAWRRLRMEWAQSLLTRTSLPISEVGRRVGYADAFYFSKVFCAEFGAPPTAYRMSVQGGD